MDTYVLGSVVPLTFECFGTDGALAAPTTAVLTITLPNGTTVTPTLDNPDVGVYVLDYTPAAVGRHVAVFVSTGAAAGAAADVFDVLAASAAIVTLADAKAYLGTSIGSWTDPEILAALDAERSAQADICRVDDFTPALREALLRRVARNLAARGVPVVSVSSFDAGGSTVTRVPRTDPEVARLEAPYRRLVLG